MTDSLAPSLVLGHVVEAQSTVDGLKVRLQRLDRPAGVETDWLRIVSPMAGDAAGFCFMPEEGDLAVAAFHGRQAMVLGFIYGGGVATPAGDPHERTIQSRDGNAMVLVDGDRSGIILRDKHGNEIRMDKDGITLKSAKDITVEAKGTATVKGTTVELNP
ncbi:phage baseplate assembly protein V [Actinoplanes sp. NPDC049596]|uniref:phage baseplate assembly protein V n=1 Tax=unclassified Actinoplanes TaxID=2626549 RepID=UPI003413E592